MSSLPLFLSLILTILFYWKSIKILKEQQIYDISNTKIYIRNLRLYSLVQLFTYGPLIGYTFIPRYFNPMFMDRGNYFKLIEGLASMAGFINAMIFLSQGSKGCKRPLLEQLDQDLTFV